MRLRRLTLHHVRGVTERTVDLTRDGDPSGVVIVEGPNEAGKSTLAFAFDQLLRAKANANREDLRSLRPAGSDQGPRVEAELELGGHRLVYAKQFLRGRTTELRFLDESGAPTGEVLTGDEAHERVTALLNEHLDRELWESLRLRQGGGLEAPKLDNKPGLTKILGDLDDVGAIGARESSILQRAEREFLRYFAPKTKNPAGELKAAMDRSADADALYQELDARYQALAADIAEVARLLEALPRLRSTSQHAATEAEKLQAELRRVTALRELTERRLQEAELASQQLLAAQQAQQHRLEVSREHDRLDGQQSSIIDELAAARQYEADAREQAANATERLEQQQQHDRDAVARRQLAQDDFDHLSRRRHATELRARFDRAEAADAKAREAAARRDTITVDAGAISEIRSASRRLEVARSALTAAVPQVRLTARRQLDVEFGDEAATLAAGAEQHWSVTEAVELRVPEVLDLEIRPGDSIEASREAERGARVQLEEALAEVGQPTVEAAEAAATARAAAVEALGQAEAERDAILGEATLDGLRAQVQEVEGRLRAELESRTDLVPMPEDEDTAQRHLADAKVAEADATAALAEANRLYADAKEAHERCRQTAAGRDEALRTLRDSVERLHGQLESARATESDAALAERLAGLQEEVQRAEAAAAAVQEELYQAEQEGLDARAENAEQVAQDAREALDAAERQIGELEASIRALGADGIGEQRAEAEAAQQRAASDLDGVQRRAEAARRLFEVLSDQRARAQERYAAPLRERIVRYGRVLYGPGFDVELNAELSVTRRRADDLWLEVSALSAGAQEQLALLSRLACAALLADKGGVLLIDDALGNTDPQRLERLGAVIRTAGQHGQIIIFTCYPGRYAHVGGAIRIQVRRDPPRVAGARPSGTPDPAPVPRPDVAPSASPQEPSTSPPDSLEILRCEQCDQRWTRPLTRGRKPRHCGNCRSSNRQG